MLIHLIFTCAIILNILNFIWEFFVTKSRLIGPKVIKKESVSKLSMAYLVYLDISQTL